MNRYYSNSDDALYTSHRQPDVVHASGWQSPSNINSLSSIIRLIVECPFEGSEKCDYTIDRSERGRLIISARCRNASKFDHLSSNKIDNIAVQTLTIPSDADVDHLNSFVERNTKSLIIEIPRLSSSSYINTSQVPTKLIQSSNVLRSSADASQLIYDDTYSNRNYYDNNQKLEYVIDCDGCTAEELDVYIQDNDLIVRGATARALSSSPIQKHVTKEFSRKISLPNTVDVSRVISYFQSGQLRVEAPLKHKVYYSQDRMLSPGIQPIALPYNTTSKYNRIQSPIPGGHQRHYRRQEHVSRRREYDHGDTARSLSPVPQIYSTEDFRYPMYRSLRDLNNKDDTRRGRYRRRANYERYVTNGNGARFEPMWISSYSPTNNVVRTATPSYHYYPMNETSYYFR